MHNNTLDDGRQLNNSRYTLIRVLGRGGFGITYVAEDTELDQKVVIKEYFPSTIASRADDGCVRASADNTALYQKGLIRFLDEARVLASLFEVSGVVKILDYFEENNTAYMVMEYVRGVSLRKHLEQNTKEISFEEAFNSLLPMIDALEKIHEKGLIHRDINPDNIMVQEDGSFKLLDFGSAREFFLEQDREKTMSIIVKNGYAPAEQYEAHSNQGPWVDVYSICATLYEMITGCVPMDAAARMIKDKLYPPSSFGVSITAEQEELLVKKGLAVNYTDRFSSMAELRDAFAPKKTVKKKSHKLLIIIIAAIVILMAATGLIIGTYSDDKEIQAAGSYSRGSDEYKEFMSFVKKNATDVEHLDADGSDSARTVYTLKESSVKEWGAPANFKSIDQTKKEFLSYLKEKGYDTTSVNDTSSCTVTTQKYGIIETEFGHFQRLEPGKGGPSFLVYEYDVVSKKINRFFYYFDDINDESQYDLLAEYICDFSPGDFPVEYKKKDMKKSLIETTKNFQKDIEENGDNIWANHAPTLTILWSKADNGLMRITLYPRDMFDGISLYEW